MSGPRSSKRVFIGLLVLVALLSQALMPAAGAQGTRSPVLSVAAAVTLPSTHISVQGHGFSPGGLVYLAVYDRWGTELHEHVWVVASAAHFGVNGSADPAQDYVAAGAITEVIDLFPATVYGPNGSQDPAQGYVPGADQATLSTSCGRDMMVRAYDKQAAAWSNLLDISAAC